MVFLNVMSKLSNYLSSDNNLEKSIVKLKS